MLGVFFMSVKIRKFEEKDVQQAVELCNEIREYHRKILGGYFMPVDRDFEKNALLSTLGSDESYAVVAAENDKIVGLLIANKKYAPYLEKPVVCEIGTLVVAEKYKRCGIGKMLMNEFLTFCKNNGIQEVKLNVFNVNKDACKFYEDYGFEPQRQEMSLKLEQN